MNDVRQKCARECKPSGLFDEFSEVLFEFVDICVLIVTWFECHMEIEL